ncbi:MAG: carbon starvation CstA family protein [Pirellulales bacterium]
MTLLLIVVVSAVVLSVAYATYGRLLAKLLQIDPNVETPAYELRDDVDYVPTETKFLMSQHFSAIAAAGPIVGPITAGVMFGWLPALIWILVGSIFIGGVHDMTALVASVRHKARSIAEVVRDHMTQRSYLLFLSFVWLALVYIIVAFTDITAGSFVGLQELENGQKVTGAGIATSSLLYLVLPIIMGLLLRYTKLSVGWATVIFLPLVGLAIWIGQQPGWGLDIAAMWQGANPELTPEAAQATARKTWDVLLLGYCLVAGAIPVWLLLQPRGHLGGYFLYIALAGGMLGLVLGGLFEPSEGIKYPKFLGWTSASGATLFPMLFITIACGACSGFHSLIASGTTSKQLRRETDARPIGYGTMLLEAMVAIVSLCCVMAITQESVGDKLQPNFIYARGIGNFLNTLGVPPALGVSFALMAFTTFVYDTLDVCTRLGRFIIQELTGWEDAKGRWLGTSLTAGVPLFFVMQSTTDLAGKPIPVWQAFWSLFGASNQLLAALTLLGVTVWLWRTRGAWWVWLVTGVPMVFMYAMSAWALVDIIRARFKSGISVDPVAWIAVVLVALAALMLVEAARVLLARRPAAQPPLGRPAPATA